MGPYAFTQAFLSGFFAFAGVTAIVFWLRARHDFSLVLLAVSCGTWAVQSAAVLSVASSATVDEAQRALGLRIVFGSLAVAGTVWMFAEVTGIRARPFLWFVTAAMFGVAIASIAGAPLAGRVTGIERLSLPWGEVLSVPARTQPSVIALPTYIVVLSATVFTVICGLRVLRQDRNGGALLIFGAVAFGMSSVAGVMTDILQARLPYPGTFAVAVGIVAIAMQFARADRQRDEQLSAADRRFRAIFDQTFQFIGLMAVDGTMMEANETALRFSGLRTEDVIGRKIWDTSWWSYSPDAQNRVRDAVRRAAAGEAVRFEAAHPGPDGQPYFVDFSLRPLRDAHGAVALLIPEGHDITERKAAEEALRGSEERFRFLIQNQTEFVVSCLPDTRLTFVNDSYSRYVHLDPDAIVGTPLLDRVVSHDRERFAGRIAELTPDAPVALVECQVVAGTGQHRWAQWTISGAFASDGVLATLQMTGRDVHDRVVAEEAKRKLEQQLLQAQKMEALGQLAGGVAHDFNNLLTVIAGHTDMLMDEIPGDGRRDLEQIRLACERAAAMTRQLLAFSRRTVLEPKIIDINTVIAQTATMLRRTIGTHIELTVAAESDLRRVKADPDQLSRVLLNMAINARDAMPDGGRLTIETRNVTVSDGDGGRGDGDYVELAMSDTGSGIPADVKARLFEPFFTTKPQGKGTGLGLAVVDGIVKQSGGWVDVESEVDAGTTFRIFLPATEHQAGDARVTGEASNAHGTETVLLVEDEAAVRDMTQTALQRFGYTVLAVANGEDALLTLAESKTGFDLLLTDVVMPDMSGPELAERVRRQYPAVAVVFMSGYTSDSILREGVEAGDTNFVQKPFSTAALAAKLRQVLDRR
jgi:two-component system cell cycle sensor histidine kinase/response regulator CckA